MIPCFFIFGFGYTAKALTNKLLSQDFRIIGTSRTTNEQQKNNVSIQLIDFDCPSLEDYLSRATHLLICIPPSSTLDDLVLNKYSDIIKKQSSHLQWLGYLSSTGVYGDYQGKWVDEESKCIPHTKTGVARLKAEQAWISFATDNHLPLHVFRLSGIYGPGRNALARLIHGKTYSIVKQEQVFCRVHVEDIVSTLIASIQSPNPLSIYNVSDDEPAPAHVVDSYAAKLLNREPPTLLPFSEANLSPMEQEFYANNRRVSNLKIKKELKVTLKYPTYKEGLTEIWRNEFARE
ncbi:SDR family oxidoreductase [Legionella waltersii]|uniref:NAD-dependent epimerase/dehydratase n=1 Tax=Legionella waltersii TaxID=66969 RepID=A0A0W1ALS1_9GAMM|nr:SDR family oxidoreductase [Legionella waltersii]KTD82208.1 NAD-dependent epimerase/dehydratase [Legionella waltersii]SNV10726.1 oxidoreductase (NAD-dependent epimerase/dehydratase) [Legionella waltersii]